jgi:predicted nucleic acid-binding Zn ribbon protein
MKIKKKTKPKYLACIWCGGNIPKEKPHAMYCSEKCNRESKGQLNQLK